MLTRPCRLSFSLRRWRRRSMFTNWVVPIGCGLAVVLVVWGRSRRFISKETFARRHDFIYGGSMRGVFAPAFFEESPNLGGEPNVLSVRRKFWSASIQYPERGSWVTQFLERGALRKDLRGQHREGKNVGGFGLYNYFSHIARWVDDLRSEPPRVPSGR